MTWHRARALMACALGVLAVVPLAARTAGRRAPGRPGRLGAAPIQAAALSPWAALASLSAVALAASVAWWLAGLLAIPAAVLAAGQLPRRTRVSRDPAAPAGPGLRFLTLNALFGAADPVAIVDVIRRLKVDVLAVQELTPDLVDGLAEAGLGELLPSMHVEPDPGAAGTGLWSRWELTPLPSAAGLLFAAPSARVIVSGLPVTLHAVHPVAPIMGRQRGWHQDLVRLRQALTATPGAQVVGGDFNASRDHRPFRDLLADGFADSADIARKRPWPGFTWPANRRYPPVMRLDHILVSPGITVSEACTLKIPGTDHRAVLAVLELPSPALRPARSRPAESAAH